MSVKNKRKRNRLIKFDYASNGLYFVTICTNNREHLFGGVYNDFMCVNKVGSVVYRQWEWLFSQYSYIKNHGFVVMPNHVHGIIEIDRGLVDNEIENVNIQLDDLDNNSSDKSRVLNYSAMSVGTGLDLSLPVQEENFTQERNQTKIISLSNIVGAFKTTSSKIIHQQCLSRFAWQRSFHDHIIRNEKEYYQIYKYVQMNPVLWGRDRNNI